MSRENPLVSVVAPAMNEAGNLTEYVRQCLAAFRREGVVGEVLIVDDGSTDGTGEILGELVARHAGEVRGFRHRRNMGLTQALRTGFENARGSYILWISPDLEAHPVDDIPLFLDGFRSGADVVAGYRKGRGDGKNLASWIYNFVSNSIFGLALRDMNWMKGFKRECLPALEMRSDWHRFLLIMLHRDGFKIAQREMQWHPRRYGKSKFGLLRFPRALVDVISVWFLIQFSRRPMRLFGTVGVSCIATGAVAHAFLVYLYLAEAMQIRPLFWSALALELAGILFFLFGFLAELVEQVRDDLDELRIASGRAMKPWVEIGVEKAQGTRDPEAARA